MKSTKIIIAKMIAELIITLIPLLYFYFPNGHMACLKDGSLVTAIELTILFVASLIILYVYCFINKHGKTKKEKMHNIRCYYFIGILLILICFKYIVESLQIQKMDCVWLLILYILVYYNAAMQTKRINDIVNEKNENNE